MERSLHRLATTVAFSTLLFAASAAAIADSPAEERLAAGIEAYEEERFQHAVEDFQRAAELGSAEAAFRLAFMYEHGEGVNPSTRRAIEWYRHSAERGHEPAQFNLGQLYAAGRGVEQDPEEGARWYRMSAEQGNPHAKMTLALMYYHGDAGQRDLIEAYYWITLAVHGYDANHFRDNANRIRRHVMDDMSDEQREEGRRRVNEALGHD